MSLYEGMHRSQNYVTHLSSIHVKIAKLGQEKKKAQLCPAAMKL